MNQKVLLLGASGAMGFAAFRELWARKSEEGTRRYDLVLLLRPSRRNKDLFKAYEAARGIRSIAGRGLCEDDAGSLKIVWGDATLYGDVVEAVRGVDWILCPMAFIAPAADHDPENAKAVNTTAIQHVIKAIHEVGGRDRIKLVYVGTVAETGDRLQTIHMGRVGDPLKPSMFDFYATTKIAGQRAVIESGLRYWVSLRQTYIAPPDPTKLMDPIMFHQPIDTHIELNTSADAGRGLANCLDVPEDSDFWRRVYNMAGGPSCRVVFLAYFDTTMRLLGIGDYRKITERRWFALRNFHCQWFEDSHVLNGYIHNWNETLEDHYRQVKENAPRIVKVAGALSRVPGIRWALQKIAYGRMQGLVSGKDGTKYWYEHRKDGRISAFYGSYEAYESIPDWDVDMPDLTTSPIRLDHGYDEAKLELDLGDLQGAARFRGGRLLTAEWSGDLYDRLPWQCAFGHVFEASAYLVLKTGHWCPHAPCTPPPWNYDEIARRSPFFAQVWYPNHRNDEHNEYEPDCYRDIL